MQRFILCFGLFVLSPCASPSEIDEKTTAAIRHICVSPADHQSHTEVSGGLHAILRFLLGVAIDHQTGQGPPRVPDQDQAKNLADYRQCAIEVLKISASPSPSQPENAVLLIDTLGEEQSRKQYEERLTLTIHGERYTFEVNASHKEHQITVRTQAGDYMYTVDGYSVENGQIAHQIIRKSVSCQDTINLSTGGVFAFERRSETADTAQVCLKKLL